MSLLAAAREKLRRPDPLAALPLLDQAAQDDGPDRVDALLALWRVRTGLGQDAVAAADARTLLALRPQDEQARFLLGRSLILLGFADLALSEFRRLAPPFPAWWLAMVADARRALSAARRLARIGCRAWRDGQRDAPEFARLLLRAGRPRAAAAVLAARPVAEQGDWAAALLRLRLAEGVLAHPLGPLLPDPATLSPRDSLATARLLLQAGEAGAAEAAMASVTDESLAAEDALLRGRLLILAGAAARFRAFAVPAFLSRPGRTDRARLALTALVLDRAVPVWRPDRQAPDPMRPARPASKLPARQVRDPAMQSSGPPLRVPLVQYWDAPQPPADVRDVMESWVRHNPGLPLARFDAAGARDFLAGIGTEALAAFDACHHPAMQSDVLRMVFLARHGGLWADVDERCIRPVSEWLSLLPRVGLLAGYSDEIPYYVHSYVLAAPPDSAVMRRVVARMLPPLARAARLGERVDIWQATGPGLLTRAVAAEPDPAMVALLAPDDLRAFAEPVEDLAYRRTRAGNWRLA